MAIKANIRRINNINNRKITKYIFMLMTSFTTIVLKISKIGD
jgi:hypothetical protein